MRDSVMIIGEARNDFERMKGWFAKRPFEVKGVRSLSSAPDTLEADSSPLQAILLCTRGDFDGLFRFYERLRTSEAHKGTPLVIMADFNTQAALARNVKLDNTQVIGISITDDNVQKIIDTALGIEPEPEPEPETAGEDE